MAVKPINRDIFFLSQKAELATKEDAWVIMDLMDTLKAHEEDCIGMAANMIGVNKRIIAVSMGDFNVAMINPFIVSKSRSYEVEEGCLCHNGEKKVKRFMDIEVEYEDATFHPHKQKFTGWIAEVIQHEIDHCDGKLI